MRTGLEIWNPFLTFGLLRFVKTPFGWEGDFLRPKSVLNQTKGKVDDNFPQFQTFLWKILVNVFWAQGNCMEDFKNRLLEFIDGQLGLSQREFERRCGLAQGTVPSIGVKGPSVDVLMKISNTYPELDLNWLIAGRGTMLVQEHVASTSHQNDIHHNQQVVIANWGDLKGVIEEVIKANGR